MTTYYVRKGGSNANAGTSAGAAWLTIGKALGAAGIASGDTVYIGAGTYREVVSVAMTSPTVETFVIGDVDGVQTGDAGEVIWTAYLTNDKTAPSGSATLNLSSRDFLTFELLTLVSGNTRAISGGTSSTHITLRRLAILCGDAVGTAIEVAVAFGVPAHWLIEQCRVFSAGEVMSFTLNGGTGSDYDADIIVRNCFGFATGGGVGFFLGNAGPNTGGGGRVENCTIIGGAEGIYVNVGLSSTIPCVALNNLIVADVGLSGGAVGKLTSNYNVIYAGTPRTNNTAGANDISNNSYAPLLQIGQELQYGATLRPFLMPTAGSPLLGFGGSSPPSVDLLNAPRPAGGASPLTAVGAYERGNTFVRETGTVRSGSNAISIIGPGYEDFRLLVNAVATTVTAYVRWDATYAGTKPKMQVLNGTECGVADDTATAVGGSGSWEQLTLSFTPTANGVIVVRFLSSDTNGAGEMDVDDLLRAP